MFDLITDVLFGNNEPRADGGWASNHPLDDYWYEDRPMPTNAGVKITPELAMTYATVFSCIGKISKTVATIPRFVFERKPSVNSRFPNKEPQTSHDLHEVLHDTPNTEMDKVSYEESQMANLLGWGNRYSEIVRHSRTQRVKELWPLESKDITPTRDKQGRRVYEWRQNGVLVAMIPADRILAIPGFSFNGIDGLSPIGLQRESIGLGMVTSAFGSRLFQNGTVLRGFLTNDKPLNDKSYKQLKDSWNREFRGWERSHGTPILDKGTKYEQVGINPDDAQFLETRMFQAIEVCGIFDVPPHKIGILDNATFSNIEEQQIQWVVDTIAPWCRRIEAAMNRQLLNNDPQLFIGHVLEGLLQGDIERRYNAYAQGRINGWLATNDIRRLENLNPKPGGDDDYLTPLNMRLGNEPLPSGGQGGNSSADDDDERGERVVDWLPVVRDVAKRLVTKEVKAIENAYKRMTKASNADAFHAWLEAFYAKHEKDAAADLLPVVTAIAGEPGAATIAASAAKLYADDSLAAMQDCLANAPERIPQELNWWLHGKPSKIETLAAEWGRLIG